MHRFVFYVTAVLTKHLIFKSFLRVFHPTPEGPTKAQKKAAAITIQRFVPFFCSLTLFVHWISLEDLISLFCYITSVVFSSVFFTYLAWFRSQKKLPNRPLLSSKNPHFRNEAKCTAFLMKMSFICVKMKIHFQIKRWALDLVLIQRPVGTRKWLIRHFRSERQSGSS